MNADPASLENLRDIVVPSPVTWWPPAAGWWGVLTLLLLSGGFVALLVWQRWRANAYRRAALHELKRVTDIGQIAGILKRTALAACPREEVASLSGGAWCAWLARVSDVTVSTEVRECLTRGVFAAGSGLGAMRLRTFAAEWIRRHRFPGAGVAAVGRVPGGELPISRAEKGGAASC